jgi:hypothetical protein
MEGGECSAECLAAGRWHKHDTELMRLDEVEEQLLMW